MKQSEKDDQAESKALQKPPVVAEQIDRFLKRDHIKKNQQENADDSRPVNQRSESELGLGEFEREKEIGNDRMKEGIKSADDTDLLAISHKKIEGIEVARNRADEKGKRKEDEANSNDHFVRHIEGIDVRWRAEEIATPIQEVRSEDQSQPEGNDAGDGKVVETKRLRAPLFCGRSSRALRFRCYAIGTQVSPGTDVRENVFGIQGDKIR